MVEHIIYRWRMFGGFLGAGIGGGLGFIISWYQPIDGVPGHELITPEDFSIIFGFLLAAVVFAFVGALPGALLGNAIGGRIASRKRQAIEKAEQTQVYIEEQRLRLQATFYNIWLDKLIEIKEDVLSDRRQLSDEDIGNAALEETALIVREEMGFTSEQLADMMDFDQFVAGLADEAYTNRLAEKFEAMQREESKKLTKQINKAYRKLFLETLNQKKTSAQATGLVVNPHALATEVMNETSMTIAKQFGLSYAELAEIIDYEGLIARYGSG